MTGYLKRFWLAISISYVSLLPVFYPVYDKLNRYYLFWDWRYIKALTFCLFLLAFAFLMAYAIGYMWLPVRGRVRAVVDSLIVLGPFILLVRGTFIVIENSSIFFGLEVEKVHEWVGNPFVKLSSYLIIPIILITVNRQKVKIIIRGIYYIISPAVLIFFFIALTSTKYMYPNKPLEPFSHSSSNSSSADHNIYIFLFDGWSYQRTFRQGKILDVLPELKRLKAVSTCYHNTYSPGLATCESIPHFLFQNDKQLLYALKLKHLEKKLLLNPQRYTHTNIFAPAKEKGYFTALVGWYLNYDHLTNHTIDWVNNISFYRPYKISFCEDCKQIFETLTVLPVTLIRRMGVNVPHLKLREANQIKTQKGIEKAVKRIIKEVDQKTLAFFHYPIPHTPFGFNRNGPKELEDVDKGELIQNYADNLAYLDTVVEDILKTLRQSGKYERSLLIFLSDHGWRDDPEYRTVRRDKEKLLRHIPLFIKYPGQSSGADNFDTIETTELYRIISAFFSDN